jgi:hypothetical protein
MRRADVDLLLLLLFQLLFECDADTEDADTEDDTTGECTAKASVVLVLVVAAARRNAAAVLHFMVRQSFDFEPTIS